MENNNNISSSSKKDEPEASVYTILPNGKVRRLKATGVDIFAALIFPLIGIIIGVIALLRGERKRGITMMLVGLSVAIVVTLFRLF